jgi:hypothetical protein
MNPNRPRWLAGFLLILDTAPTAIVVIVLVTSTAAPVVDEGIPKAAPKVALEISQPGIVGASAMDPNPLGLRRVGARSQVALPNQLPTTQSAAR